MCQEWRVNAYIDLRVEPIRGNDGEELVENATAWWNASLTQLNNKYPVKHSGFWPDPRLQ